MLQVGRALAKQTALRLGIPERSIWLDGRTHSNTEHGDLVNELPLEQSLERCRS